MRTSNSSPARQVEIECIVLRSTEKAIQISIGTPEQFWIPKSQISDYSGDTLHTADSIFIPEWLATEKGLV